GGIPHSVWDIPSPGGIPHSVWDIPSPGGIPHFVRDIPSPGGIRRSPPPRHFHTGTAGFHLTVPVRPLHFKSTH
ncbi:MAG: hypothetical protein LUD16_07085, partial [Lachnospiraceae bacterium]|nr:hypothetical protein [Lachnospiraceae bacterium]